MTRLASNALLSVSFRLFTHKNAFTARLKFDCPASPYAPIDMTPSRGERATYALMGGGLG